MREKIYYSAVNDEILYLDGYGVLWHRVRGRITALFCFIDGYFEVFCRENEIHYIGEL